MAFKTESSWYDLLMLAAPRVGFEGREEKFSDVHQLLAVLRYNTPRPAEYGNSGYGVR